MLEGREYLDDSPTHLDSGGHCSQSIRGGSRHASYMSQELTPGAARRADKVTLSPLHRIRIK